MTELIGKHLGAGPDTTSSLHMPTGKTQLNGVFAHQFYEKLRISEHLNAVPFACQKPGPSASDLKVDRYARGRRRSESFESVEDIVH